MKPRTFLVILSLILAIGGFLAFQWQNLVSFTSSDSTASARSVESDSKPSRPDSTDALPSDTTLEPATTDPTNNLERLPVSVLPITSGRKDDAGFEVVEWPGNRPHYEGESVIAQVATGEGGRKLHLEVNQLGEYPRVQVGPQENVKVKLRFETAKPGMPIALTAQDGGTMAGEKMTQSVALDAERSATFDFTASSNVGTHRVTIVTPVGEVKTLDFWVGDLNTMRTTAQR